MDLFSWWENTKLDSNIFREHVSFGAGLEEKVLLSPIGQGDTLSFKHLKNIKQERKQDMSGNYFCVIMFGVLFSVTQKWWKCEKKGSRCLPIVSLYYVQMSCQVREKHNCHEEIRIIRNDCRGFNNLSYTTHLR